MDGTVQCEELSKAWVEPIRRWFATDLKRNQEDSGKNLFFWAQWLSQAAPGAGLLK
jgi:hypothetical protein